MCVSLFVEYYVIKHGRTPLWIAAKQGHLKVVECLVTKAKANPNQPDKVLSVIKDICHRDVCVSAWGDGCPHAHLHLLIVDHVCGE